MQRVTGSASGHSRQRRSTGRWRWRGEVGEARQAGGVGTGRAGCGSAGAHESRKRWTSGERPRLARAVRAGAREKKAPAALQHLLFVCLGYQRNRDHCRRQTSQVGLAQELATHLTTSVIHRSAEYHLLVQVDLSLALKYVRGAQERPSLRRPQCRSTLQHPARSPGPGLWLGLGAAALPTPDRPPWVRCARSFPRCTLPLWRPRGVEPVAVCHGWPATAPLFPTIPLPRVAVRCARRAVRAGGMAARQRAPPAVGGTAPSPARRLLRSRPDACRRDGAQATVGRPRRMRRMEDAGSARAPRVQTDCRAGAVAGVCANGRPNVDAAAAAAITCFPCPSRPRTCLCRR